MMMVLDERSGITKGDKYVTEISRIHYLEIIIVCTKCHGNHLWIFVVPAQICTSLYIQLLGVFRWRSNF